MAVVNGKRVYFPKVQEAKEFLLDKAKAMVELQEKLILEAAAAGEYEAALKANQWLIEHVPADQDGQRVIGPSASKPGEVGEGKSGPTIQIGIAFGGIKEPAALPEIIDITPTPSKE